jgi:hypothetical protein
MTDFDPTSYVENLNYDLGLERRRIIYIIILLIIIFTIVVGYVFFYIYYTDTPVGPINPPEVEETSIGELYNIGQYFLFTGYTIDGVSPIDGFTKDRNYNDTINGSKLTKNTCNKKNMIFDDNYCKCITPFWGEFCEKQSISSNYYQLGKYFGSIDQIFEKTNNIETNSNIAWCSNFSINNNSCDPNNTIEYACKTNPLCIGYFYNQGTASFLYAESAENYLFSLNVDKIDNIRDEKGNYLINGNIFIKNDYQKYFSRENIYLFDIDIYDNLPQYWIFENIYNSSIVNPLQFTYDFNINKYLTISRNNQIILNGNYYNYYIIYFFNENDKMTKTNDWSNFCLKISQQKYFFTKRTLNIEKTTYVYFVSIENLIRYCNFII